MYYAGDGKNWIRLIRFYGERTRIEDNITSACTTVRQKVLGKVKVAEGDGLTRNMQPIS